MRRHLRPFQVAARSLGKENRCHLRREAGVDSYHSCDTYDDFRELLQRKDIDAVGIATPDHWHVPIALAAIAAGKDVYVEKPLGLSVNQNRALRAAINRTQRVFQYGTQQRSVAARAGSAASWYGTAASARSTPWKCSHRADSRGDRRSPCRSLKGSTTICGWDLRR